MASPSTAPEAAPEEPIRFRPSKKRKILRKRTSSSDNEDDNTPSQSRAVAADYFPEEDDDLRAVVKARNARRNHNRGLAFRSGRSAEPTSQALVPTASSPDDVVVQGITDRFTKQTGLITDQDDKHMNEYIESRLRNRAAQQGEPQNDGQSFTDPANTVKPAPNQPIMMQGRLMEVDLPTADAGLAHGSPSRGHKKNAPSSDMKPARSRNRRGSDDIKRDELVEQFLHENRLEVYDIPDSSAATDGNEADGDADERLAAEFRRQFEEDVALRRQRKRAQQKAQTTKSRQPGSSATKEILRGPKLGGSRNSRAAVRDALLLQQEQEKKNRR